MGKVYLIGAGPGDPELLTLKGKRVLEQAQVVIYDRLVGERLLRWAREGAELIYAGKSPQGRALTQEEINALLVAKAREGKVVARLKGGDPFVLGRGGEEAEALVEAGIPFEIIPGVSSAIAVPAYAGIPLTHRQMASSFTVVTGHEDPNKETPSLNWEALARAETLVILMGMEKLGSLVKELAHRGRHPQTPIALIHWGTLPRQQTVVATLADIEARAQEAGLNPPVVAVVGEVVKLRSKLAWFEKKPLFGKRVLVLRDSRQAEKLSLLLAQEGAEPVELPAIQILPPTSYDTLDRALAHLEEFSWVIFTSSNGVEAFYGRLFFLGRDSRSLRGRVCALGPATASALKGFGITADLLPEEYSSDGVLAALKHKLQPGEKVLLPRTDIAGKELEEGLSRLGVRVESAVTYLTRPSPAPTTTLERIDIIAFTSPSTVRSLYSWLVSWERIKGALVACIGPTTARACQELGLKVDIIAPEHTIPGLVRALVEACRS